MGKIRCSYIATIVIFLISATDKNIFALVDSEGKEITEEKQLGLLLYRGGTVCVYHDHFTFKAADAICKELNFTRAERWTTKESFDIQNNYEITADSLYCIRAEWESCSLSERYVTESYGWCKHSKDLFLSCTGKHCSSVSVSVYKRKYFLVVCIVSR